MAKTMQNFNAKQISSDSSNLIITLYKFMIAMSDLETDMIHKTIKKSQKLEHSNEDTSQKGFTGLNIFPFLHANFFHTV